MGKQSLPLILGFVNYAARNSLNVSQKQAQNKNVQNKNVQNKSVQKPQQNKSVNKKANNTKETQPFKNWADELPKQTWSMVVKQSKTQQQRPKVQQQQAKQGQKQQVKQGQKQQSKNVSQPSWGWYPASKHDAELKKYYQGTNKSTNKVQNRQQIKPQMRNAPVMKNKKRVVSKKEPNVMKFMNNLYDAFNYTFPSENGRRAWICSNKVGGDKVLSVATVFAIRNAPATRSKKAFVERNGQVIFNNKCIRHAVEGRFTGHKKFRGTRVLTYIPEKWLSQENGYAKGANYEKYANINGPKRNERCFSFKGVY